MSYNYLLDLYTKLDQRKEEIDTIISSLAEDTSEYNFEKGRQDLHKEFAAFLHENYDKRLPRAIQKALKNKPRE